MGQNEIDYLTGPGIEGRHEVAVVKRELGKIGIFLEGFGITITGVYIKPRPFGFDFDCKKPQALLALARSKAAVLNPDDTDTLEGKVSALQTHGEGFRQIGSGPRLHLEIAMDGKCNVHIDSHGYVTGPGQYDYNRALEHGRRCLPPRARLPADGRRRWQDALGDWPYRALVSQGHGIHCVRGTA